MSTNSIHKKCLKSVGKMYHEIKVFTKVSTKSVHKAYPQKGLTKNVHKISRVGAVGGGGLINAKRGPRIYYVILGPVRPHKILHPMYI